LAGDAGAGLLVLLITFCARVSSTAACHR
jgi:hypothetical protein